MYVGTYALLDGPDGPFNFTNVVVMGRNVEMLDGKKIVLQTLELNVSKNDNYVKTAFLVQVEDGADAVEEASFGFLLEGQYSAEAELARDGVEKQ
jgi:hypothetical protein